MRLIDADALKGVMIETLEKIKANPKMDNQEAHVIAAFHTVGLMIDDAPTVDAVPVVHGHWEIVPNDENKDGHYKMRCSVCGSILWSIEPEELYCCKCGAKMDECADGEAREE